jgi:hypothetical protein
LVSNTISGGTPAASRRAASSVHWWGKYRRPATGAAISPLVTTTSTLTWQLACFPTAPQYWCATPTDLAPCFSQPVSSMIQADSGSKTGMTSRRMAPQTCSASQGLSATNCCNFWLSTPRRAAIGSIDFRSPASNSPCTYNAAPSRRSLRPSSLTSGSMNAGNSAMLRRQTF